MGCVTRLQILSGTTAERMQVTPLLGELVFDETLCEVFIGDGVTQGGKTLSAGLTCRGDVINLTAGSPVNLTNLFPSMVCFAKALDDQGNEIELCININGTDVEVVSNVDLSNVQIKSWGR